MSRLKLALVPMLMGENRSLFQAAYQRFMVPLAPIALASYIESLNLPVEVFVHDNIDAVVKFKPDLVGLSSVSENFGYAQRVAKRLKKEINPFIIVGGPHFTSLPEYLPECFDVGGVGEGEKILEDVVRTLLDKGSDLQYFKNIPGIAFRENGKVVIQPRRPQIENLDALPIPNRKRWVTSLGVPHVMTTRGCVYSCFFCAEPTLFKKYREVSPSRVADEVESILRDYPQTRHIRFFDDIFIVNRRRLRAMAQLFEERGITKRVSFSSFVHAKLLDEETVDLLKRMNFVFVQFGAETGSPKLIEQIKPSSTVDINQRAIDLCYKKGLAVGLTIIVGTPEETSETMEATYRFIYKNRKKIFDTEVSPAVAIPGTDLFQHARQRGLIGNFETLQWDVFRDASHLTDFDPNKYIYLAEKIPLPSFISTLHRMWSLIEDLHEIHDTKEFLRDNFLAGYMPVAFQDPASTKRQGLPLLTKEEAGGRSASPAREREEVRGFIS